MLLALLILAGAGWWAWKTGRLKVLTLDDAAAIAAVLIGLRLLTTGRPLIGLLAIAGAAAFAWWQRKRPRSPAMSPEEARKLLGVSHDASLDEVRRAHRQLIAKVHPDAGGSEALAARVNQARDTLIKAAGRGDRLT